jgi:ribonuclease Z
VQDCDVLVPDVPLPERHGAVQGLRCVHGHRELAELAQAARVRNLVLSHVTTHFDRSGMRERVLREVCEVFDGNVYFGEDLMKIPFTAPAASKLD